MCLAFPAKVLDVGEKKVLVEAAGRKIRANSVVEKLKKGDYVLVQQGFAVERLSEQEAKEAIAALKQKSQGKH